MVVQDALDLSDVKLELFVGALFQFATAGAALSHFVSDKFGRRGGLLVAAFGFVVGTTIMSLSRTYATLMTGRAVVGLCLGFGLAVDPVYIAEISPALKRGELVTWSEIAMNVGIVLGYSSGLVFHAVPANMAWRYMFGLGAVLPVVMIWLACCVMPESPRWLVQKGREEEAANVFMRIYPEGYNVQPVVREIKEGIRLETEAASSFGWTFVLVPTPAYKRMLVLGIGVAISQQLVGVDALGSFLVYVLDEAGIQSRVMQSMSLILVGTLKLGVVICASKLVDRVGRRLLFFISLGGMTVALLVLAVDFARTAPNSFVAIVGLAAYFSFFSIGFGPGAWLIPSEVFTTSIRAKAMSAATFMNRLTGSLLTSTFLTVADYLSWSALFLLLTVICGLVAIFLYCLLPETKGKALEDMAVYFAEITGDQTILDVETSLERRRLLDEESHELAR